MAESKQFGMTSRPELFPAKPDASSPGPGQYLSPSHFGQYIAAQIVPNECEIDKTKMVKTLVSTNRSYLN